MDTYKLISTIFNIIFITIILISLSKYILILSMLSCCIYSYTFFRFKKKIQESSFNYFESENRYASKINEPYENITNIRQNSISPIFFKRLKYGFEDFLKSKIIYGKVSYLYTNTTDFIYTISTMSIMLLCGVQVINKEITIGEATYIATYFNIMLTSLGSLLSIGQQYKEFIVSYDRLREIIETETIGNGSVLIDTMESIHVDSLKYSLESTSIISDFNYTFKVGNIYAISGKNGKGKSTLLNLLTGVLKATEGSICYNGVNTNDLDMIKLRKKHVSFMSQNIFILDDSIENNIYLNLDIDKSKEYLLHNNIELFNFNEYLLKQNKSVHKNIDKNLSEGEKQKIGLIRSFIKNSGLIILDEPTSSLDINTILKLKEKLQKLKSEKIIIIVSHDEKILDIADYEINLNEMA